MLSPLNNRINFIIVNCLQHVLCILGLKQQLPCHCIHTIQVFSNRQGAIVQTLFILKLEPDLNPKPEKLCEHGVRVKQYNIYGNLCDQYYFSVYIRREFRYSSTHRTQEITFRAEVCKSQCQVDIFSNNIRIVLSRLTGNVNRMKLRG